MTTPFDYDNIYRLLEYLNQQESGHSHSYAIKLTTRFIDYINGFESIGRSTFQMRVRGIRAVRALFVQYRKIDIITWSHGNTLVQINCKERSLHIETGSIHFLEVCRHTMTGQEVSKITVDLNPL